MSLKTKRIKRSNKRDYRTRKRKRTRKSSSGGIMGSIQVSKDNVSSL